MPTDFDKELDHILTSAIQQTIMLVNPDVPFLPSSSHEIEAGQQAFEAVKQAVDKYVIGEDDSPRNTSEHGKRNFLRLEQRRSLWGPKAKA